ncbi:uncharacterized protein ARMOST_19540 [Armillaria ostoyae]|uniref:Uncharacterized protein n=1 Tax=Armillaria ostoyae TaxID=47428 RepID=A0A284S4V6_ARMOS|nr:uncharacterized protein ARMOST_19540 [Armillaria ostoyae]
MQTDNCPTCGVPRRLNLEYEDGKVLDILRAGQPLLECDHDWVHRNSAAVDGDLQSLRQSLSHLESLTALIRSQIDVALETRQRFESIRAPIRSLPRDVLIDIFYLCRPKRLCYSLACRSYPWLLGHVCHSWRDIVHSSPMLWTSIILRPQHCRPSSVDVLDEHLKCSGNIPLNVCLFMYSNGGNHEKDIMARVTKLAHRWSKLKIEGQQYENFPPSFPALRTLTASNIFKGDVYFFDAPLLRTVRLGDDVVLKSFVLPSHITHLALAYLYAEDFSQLQLYPCLVEFHFSSYFVDGSDPIPSTITHPTIRCLSVSEESFLEFLVLPALEDLRICSTNYHVDLQTVSVFLSRSGCSLKTLSVDLSGSEILLAFLVNQPSLHGLSLMRYSYYRRSDVVLQSLARPDFLPNLESIEINYDDREFHPWVVQTIEERWYAPVRRLRKFVVFTESVTRSEVAKYMQEMIDEGLDVKVLKPLCPRSRTGAWLDPHMTGSEDIPE